MPASISGEVGHLYSERRRVFLRSLLHSILSQRNDLVQTCFPGKFDQLRFGVDDESEVISLVECIKPAFKILTGIKTGMKIFFTIDGLDEFDGDHAETSKFFVQLMSNTNFKVLLSSRPISACVETFKKCPSLRLQDLTREDIHKYVEETIGRHERMHQLLLENPKEASHLQELIISKASGVFLWVRLVVKSLLDGFRNYDRLSDLQSRVNEYPAELGSFYLYIFQKLEVRYQSHAAQLLRIMVQSIAIQEKRPLTVVQMAFADEVGLTHALRAPIKPLTPQERRAKCDSMEGRIRSRCWGLLEVVHKDSPHGVSTKSEIPEDRLFYASEVQVLHKSVLDFLAEEAVWSKLLSATPKFDPNSALAAASLMQVKTLPTALEVDHNVKHCLAYCRLLEKSTGRPQTSVVNELNRVVCMRGGEAATWDKADDLPYTGTASGEVPLSPRMQLLASEAGLSRYFDIFLTTDSSTLCDVSILIPRLVSVMTDTLKRANANFDLANEYTNLITVFLNYLSNLPSSQGSYIRQAWIGTFLCIAQIKETTIDWANDQGQFDILHSLLSIIQRFLELGADVNSEISSDTYSAYPLSEWSWYMVAWKALLPWLEQLLDSLGHASDENATLEQQMNFLRLEINVRVADDPKKIKQQAWTNWLSSRALQIDAERVARLRTSKLQRAIRAIPGGPFELHADSVVLAARMSSSEQGSELRLPSQPHQLPYPNTRTEHNNHGKRTRKRDWFISRLHQRPT